MGDKAPRGDFFISWAQQIFESSLNKDEEIFTFEY